MKKKPIELPESFYEDWLITEVLRVVKSGKEATVYCCRAHPATGATLLAAKVYRPREQRGFKNDAVYQEGRVILDKRIRRAFEKKTRKGREFQFSSWMAHEFGILSRLHAAGADVPRPYACDENALLLEFFGDEHGPAPLLENVALERDEAEREFERVLRNLELCLAHNVVHGDLSPYNILFWNSQARLIDFPQAVDPRANRNAFSLFERDITSVCDYFARFEVHSDPERLARSLWERFADHKRRRGSAREAELAAGLIAGVTGEA